MQPTTSEWAEVKKSSIHNNGMFATRFIPKGTRVIEYVGEKITKKETDRRATQQLEAHKKDTHVGSVYIFTLDNKYDIDGNVEYNTAKWINHSCTPNCETDIVDGHVWILSIKDIQEGDELFYDYGYDMDDYENHPCLCGTKNCVGYIVAEKYRKKLKKKLKRKKQR